MVDFELLFLLLILKLEYIAWKEDNILRLMKVVPLLLFFFKTRDDNLCHGVVLTDPFMWGH